MYREKKRVIGDDFNLLKTFDAMPGRVFSVAFRSDGKQIVAASSHRKGGTLRVCDVETGKTLWTKRAPHGLFAVAFGGGGAVIAAGGFDGIVRLHDAETGDVTTEFAALPKVRETVTPKVFLR